jgi:hypothetical protein
MGCSCLGGAQARTVSNAGGEQAQEQEQQQCLRG